MGGVGEVFGLLAEVAALVVGVGLALVELVDGPPSLPAAAVELPLASVTAEGARPSTAPGLLGQGLPHCGQVASWTPIRGGAGRGAQTQQWQLH